MNKLRKVIDDYIKKMEGINTKKIEASSKELNIAMHECKAFNELRQSILNIDNDYEVNDGVS